MAQTAEQTQSATLAVTGRRAEGSRAARRLRRAGAVPGVLYGGGSDPLPIAVPARDLRHALAAAGALLDLRIDGGKALPAVVKELQRDPLHGEVVHVDLLRVSLDQPIHAIIPLELTGADEAPGVKLGGILEQIVRELSIEALPAAIPEALRHDVSALQIGDTVTFAQLVAPDGVRLLDTDSDAVVATISAPRLQAAATTTVQVETEVVGERQAGGDGEGQTAQGAEE
jgi:large subunit ribosomal protein L25